MPICYNINRNNSYYRNFGYNITINNQENIMKKLTKSLITTSALLSVLAVSASALANLPSTVFTNNLTQSVSIRAVPDVQQCVPQVTPGAGSGLIAIPSNKSGQVMDQGDLLAVCLYTSRGGLFGTLAWASDAHTTPVFKAVPTVIPNVTVTVNSEYGNATIKDKE